MFDSFVWWNALIDARYDFYGGQITPDTLDFPALSYNVYPTKDGGSVSIAMLEEKFWAAFLKALDREDLLPYKRFRRQEAPEAFAAMESIFLSRTTQEWKDFLSDKDICAMPTQTKEEAISYIISSDTGLMRYITFPRTGKTLQTRSPISLSSVPISLDGATPCPLLGEHTVDVLKDLGYSQENIQSMIEAGAVGAYKE